MNEQADGQMDKQTSARERSRSWFLIFLILVVLPFVGRWALFYRGSYTPPEIPEIDTSRVVPPLPGYQQPEDVPVEGRGHVVIDLSHANNLEVNDLGPLRDRLEARGVTVETFDGNDALLRTQLHSATALLVFAPTEKYSADERDAIVDFVEDGGRLLLAADPTRPVPPEEEDEFIDFNDIFFPVSAVPAINSLANAFGVVYFDDYLYNSHENEGNYRNVRFTELEEHPLTEDVETIVLFASHSLRSEGTALIVGDEHTRSPLRTGEAGLAAAALSADGQVLALGDITFLTAPYHAIGDNDRFLSHIADWLAVDGRERDDLEDFPHLFKRPVDLVQASGDFLDPRLIIRGSALQASFDQAGLALNLRPAVEPGHDALFVGTFEDLALVEDYLVTAGITVTAAITEEVEFTSPDDEGPAEGAPTQPSPTSVPTTTEQLTPTPEGEEPGGETEEMPAVEQELAAEGTGEEEEEERFRGTIEVEMLGTINITGTSLFVADHSADSVVVIVLAEDGAMAIQALERLASNDLLGCIQDEARDHEIAVCSTGQVQDGAGLDAEEPPAQGAGEEPIGEDGTGARIFILSDDDGPDGVRTGAAEFEAILSESYAVTLWSTSRDGIPTDEDMAGYDAYIVDSGDYAFDSEDDETFPALSRVEGSLMLIGARPLPSFDEIYEPIDDLKVADGSHPLAAGFAQDEIILLFASESGVPAMVLTENEIDTDEVEVVLARGPASAEPDVPALVAGVGEEGDAITRLILASFAFYRLPEEAQRTLALNAAEWLLGSGE
jgi:hypothetical protein